MKNTIAPFSKQDHYTSKDFLPMSKSEMKKLGIKQCDFILVSGDAYVDHPSFGTAIIGRVLQSKGYQVGIIAQPNWRADEDFKKLGEPRLGFLVTAGNLDSMVSHFTVNNKRRHEDVYSPGGEAGLRPDRATIVYCGKIRELFGDVPIIIGGIEASLRRFAHYDYWQDKVRRPILFDSRADLLVYGMGERAMIEIAEGLDAGIPVAALTYIKGTALIVKEPTFEETVELPSVEEVITDKALYAKTARLIYNCNNAYDDHSYLQKSGNRYLCQNPPQMPLSQSEFDSLYDLPFTYTWHPSYTEKGGIPGLAEVKFSITANRGCYGNCSFCALAIHQGKYVQMRSKDSIVREAKRMIKDPDFKGYIHDIGGPTANFSHKACKKQETHGYCTNRECLFPEPCKKIDSSHQPYLETLRAVRKLPGVKKVFIRSGIRYDYLALEKDKAFFQELVEHHVSGQLRVAPEHVSEKVLRYMGKPSFKTYEAFVKNFKKYNERTGKKQYVLPYFITGHPGCTLDDAIELAEYIREMEFVPEQVQDFYPTPGSIATTMYYTGLNPLTMEAVYVPKGREKHMQRALVQYNKRENYLLVYEALTKAQREDLIGPGKMTLIPEKTVSQTPKKTKTGAKIKEKNTKSQNNGEKTRGKYGKKTNRIH
ncbi:YgiQ family radical SAM protein [Acetobacterium paludosum]|uniref:YgiQ family radical SAM protein n=1 Tax=Acetobacterium paludosum TaxID=52693 RepID=A0A923HWI3_9FIRM|nr:YgiQ family radical SAM protein [Acetobacterium paludosum]MBC3889591.1 YgiQ family radical SAM protein [Acetobacterium paludosum]